MRFVIFTHSLVSDWNHGNAHFLRGIATELIERGHDLQIYEPRNGWSLKNLLAEDGTAVEEFAEYYPHLHSNFYEDPTLDLDVALQDADVVIVHEWNSHRLVRRIGEYRADNPRFRLFFHDTHHRSVTDPAAMSGYDLQHYDGVLAYGKVIRDIYLERGWARNAWTWHEAADTRVFRPLPDRRKAGDLVWIGNWGDGERTCEIRDFLIKPVKALGLKACVYGVRYPQRALDELASSGIAYGGRLPNYRVPEILARYKLTVHIPRRPYAKSLPGIPTIRPFEAMACGIPLISAPWQDTEGLFRPGKDYLVANNTREMILHLNAVMNGAQLAEDFSANGLATIRARHSCSHRVSELVGLLGTFPHSARTQGAY